MSEKIHILYISGLGDRYDTLRRNCLKLWRRKNVSAELVASTWADGKSYEEKIARVNSAIDAARADGKRVVIIGESAGGGMAVNMYADRADDIHKVITLCGKNTRPDTVAPYLYAKNPAFKTSMYKTAESIEKLSEQQRRDFISVTPLFDPTVPVRETLLPDCQHVTIFSIGHFIPITMALTVYSGKMIRLAKA